MASNVSALATTLQAMRDAGRLEDIDAALVQALGSMASSLDYDPSNAALWRQYRETLRELMADDADGGVDEAIAELFAQPRDEAPT